jgi:DNA-binding Lrp family transcriptional regulator
MMVGEYNVRTIFVQIKCRLGTAYKVAEKIVDSIEETSEVHSTSGQFDLLVKFNIGNTQDPGVFVTSVVQRVEDVVDTHTLIAFNAFTPTLNPA